MKTELLNALKAKFEGVSEKILDRIAEKYAKTISTTEEVATCVEGVTFQKVLESYSDYRATEAQKTAISNYERNYGLKNGQKIEPKVEPKTKEDTSDDDDEPKPKWARELIESNNLLTKRLEAYEGEKLANTRKSSLGAILKDVPESIRNRYEKDFARMNFKDDDDFDSWLEEIKPDVEKISSDYQAKGGVVNRPKGGAGAKKDGEVDPLVKARIEENEAEEPTSAIQGLAK